jgi:hypothetical protein
MDAGHDLPGNLAGERHYFFSNTTSRIQLALATLWAEE